MPKITKLMRLLQFGDSMLPVGAFSFSNGLEAAVAQRVVHDAATLRAFVRTALDQAAGADGIALLVAHRAACVSDDVALVAADHAVLLRKLNEETRTMTLRMGRKLCELALQLTRDPTIARWHAALIACRTPGTLPVALALAMAAEGMREVDPFAAHQYGVATMMLGAALRLMKLSYLDGQAILHELNADAEVAWDRVAAGSTRWFAPSGPWCARK